MRGMRKGALIALLLAVTLLPGARAEQAHPEVLFVGENWVLELGDGYEVQCVHGENQLARLWGDAGITVLAKGVEAVRSGEGWLLARGADAGDAARPLLPRRGASDAETPYWLVDTADGAVHGPFFGEAAFETACAALGAPSAGAWRSLYGWPEGAKLAMTYIYDEATAWELSTLDYPGAERFSPEDCLYIDTHGGFLGDGATFARLRFAPEDGAALEQVLAEEGGWQALPVTGVAANRVNWGLPIDDCYRTTEERPEFPEITDGLWHFRNTTPDGDGVRNFELWICDSETATLYYHEYDS